METRNALVTLLETEVSGWLEDLKAGTWWTELRDLSLEEQVRKIRSTAALQSLAVFEAILAEARNTGPGAFSGSPATRSRRGFGGMGCEGAVLAPQDAVITF